MNVLNITGPLSPNAVEETCERLQSYFPRQNIKNVVLGEFDPETALHFQKNNIEVDFIGQGSPSSQIRLLFQLLVEKTRFDIFHIYGGPAIHAPVPMIVSKLFDIPIITRFNGYTNPSNKRKKVAAHTLEKNLIIASDAVVFNSQNQLEDTIDKYDVSRKENLFVVPPGINADNYYQVDDHVTEDLKENMCISKSDYVIGMVQTPRPVKQPKDAVDILQILNQVMDETIHLVVVGESDYIDEYKQYSRAKGMNDLVKWVGYKSTNDLPKWYSMFDITIMTSANESFGMSLSESYLCMTPCVAYSVGGMAEQIRDGKTGELITPGAKREFSESLEKLLLNEGLRNNYARHGRSFVLNEFSITKSKKRYKNILDHITE